MDTFYRTVYNKVNSLKSNLSTTYVELEDKKPYSSSNITRNALNKNPSQTYMNPSFNFSNLSLREQAIRDEEVSAQRQTSDLSYKDTQILSPLHSRKGEGDFMFNSYEQSNQNTNNIQTNPFAEDFQKQRSYTNSSKGSGSRVAPMTVNIPNYSNSFDPFGDFNNSSNRHKEEIESEDDTETVLFDQKTPYHKRTISNGQTDSGFTSPARSLSGSAGRGAIKFSSRNGSEKKIPVDFLKSNFQAISKYAVTFARYQKPCSISSWLNIIAVCCRGRHGTVNIFKSQSKNLQNNNNNNNSNSKHTIRIMTSFMVILNGLPSEPNGCKFDNLGNLFIAVGPKIAQISKHSLEKLFENENANNPNKPFEVIPDRLLARECDLIYGINFTSYGHIVITDDARGSISLINRDTGDKVFDYTSDLKIPLRNPQKISMTKEKDLIVTDDDRILFVDTKQNNKISTIFGGSIHTPQPGRRSIKPQINFKRPTAIYCDNYNTILLATKERRSEKINHNFKNTIQSKLSLITPNGQILIEDVLAEKSLQIVGNGDSGWNDLPAFIDITISGSMIYLLGDDKMIHCYELIRV
jgi:hypothetical protein